MTWENLWMYLLKPGLFIFGFSLFTYLLVSRIFQNYRNLFCIVPLLASILTCITIYQLQNSSVLFKTEATILQSLLDFKRNLIYPGQQQKDEQFVKDNFILINTSFDPSLIRNRDGLSGDSTFTTITDRKKLAIFLNYMHANRDLFDFVVCDIVFQDTSVYDTALKNGITNLEEEKKILLAYNRTFVNHKSTIYAGVRPTNYGEVAKVETDKPFYFTHRLVSEEHIPSLSYLMYLRSSGNQYAEKDFYLWPKMLSETDRNNNTHYTFNEFITELALTDENSLYLDSIDNAIARNKPVFIQDTSLIRSKSQIVYDLGYACTEEGQVQISDLASLKKGGQQNIVIIGNFRDAYSDKHQTAYGQLYGITILLNEFLQIHNRKHVFSAGQTIGYVSSLFLCFCVVLGFLFWWVFPKEKKVEGLKKWVFLKDVFSNDGYFTNTALFLVGEMHYVLLFAIALFINLAFHKIINVLGLLYYFLLFSAFLKFFVNKKISK